MKHVAAERWAELAELLKVEALRVVTIVRRPDAVIDAAEPLSWLFVPKGVRKARPVTGLPQDMAIALDVEDGVHLVAIAHPAAGDPHRSVSAD